MNFSDYSRRLHPHLSGINNQGHFVGALFHAAGSNFFPERPAYGTDSYQRKLFGGTKPLTQEMKDSFPKPIDTEKLNTFFKMRIGESSLSQIMSNFGIPNEEIKNKDLFILALCSQFQRIVSNAANDVDDVVLFEYIKLLRKSEADFANIFPLYPGDDILLVSELPAQYHVVGFYEAFEHTWEVKNNGTVTWEGRQLECINQAATRIKALNTTIAIPKTKPGDNIRLTVQYNARGFEGEFESIWKMKDHIGRLCFPDESKVLKVVAIVANVNSTQSEV